MSWKIVRIAAPQYVLEDEETGQAMNDHNGRPVILYSEEQALAAKASIERGPFTFGLVGPGEPS